MKTLLTRLLLVLPAGALVTGCANLPGLGAPAPAPATQQLVSEDDHVRIQELRVRGQTQRLSVHSKGSGAPDYDILPPATGQDLSQARGATGQRVWSVLNF